MRRSLLLFAFVPVLLIGIGHAFPVAVHAQEIQSGLEAVGETVKLSSTDPRVITANIINVVLGLLGIIFLSLMVYAGFLYMTSGGEAEKTSKAKKMIASAIIGLILVLSSWAIAKFIIDRLLEATGGGGTTTSQTGPGGGFGGGGVSNVFQVKSITPQGDVPIRNVQVKLLFSRPVDEATASVISVTRDGGGGVAGTILVNGSVVTFTPATPCPDPNADLMCFEADAPFTVTVGGSLRSTTGQTIVCGGFAPSCTATFRTGNLIDTQAPSVSMIEPMDGQGVPADSLVTVRAHATDDSGVAYVDIFDDGTLVDSSGPDSATVVTSFDADVIWDTAGIPLQTTRELRATAYDIDAHQAQSSAVRVVVRSPACFNGVQDGDETGVDCGGVANTPAYCGACSGGSCTVNADCSSGVCLNGMCVEQPTITEVRPIEGKPGTFVTIKGVNFGSSGSVTFLGGAGDADDVVAEAPQACVQAGIDTWSQTQAIVAVPEGAAIGPLRIVNGQSALMDATNDSRGPGIPDFVVNDAVYPGLCGLDPRSGYVGDQFMAIGQGFGSAPDRMTFGSFILTSFSVWTDISITANVPVTGIGSQAVTISAGGKESNPAAFQVLNRSTAGPPVIGSIDPAQGPSGEYVTLMGTNFGYSVGTVRFKNASTGVEAMGDTSFPEACSDGFWGESSVVVKVPARFLNDTAIIPGDYQVTLVRSDSIASNQVAFVVNTETPRPGICSIMPPVGPEGTEVTLSGERLGSVVDTVTFSTNLAALATSWVSSAVKTKVPTGAVTGPVSVAVQGVRSNSVNYQVRNCNEQADICGQGWQCCPNGTCLPGDQVCGAIVQSAMFAWRSSTGLIPVAPRVVEECSPSLAQPPIPSPSPWDKRAGGENVCTNADVYARFTTLLEPSTVSKSTFRIRKCTSASNEPCATAEEVQLDAGFPSLQPASQYQDFVKLKPATSFGPNTTYLVEILTGVKGAGAGGAYMDERPSCGEGVAYCFRFTTRASTEPCAVGAVIVTPHPYTVNDTNQPIPYLSSPLSADDKCVMLRCEDYAWDWTTSNALARFQTPLIKNPMMNAPGCRQVGYGVLETGDTPVGMMAATQGVTGIADLYVKFIPPRVVDHAPQCQMACINAAIWAKFNIEIDPDSVAGNVVVRPCANENCILSELGSPLPISEGAITLRTPPMTTDPLVRFLEIDPIVEATNDLLLVPGKYYRVLLKGGSDTGIRSRYGVPMTGLNDPEGFVWTFRTKLGTDAFCAAESVDVAPIRKIETVVGSRQMFSAAAFGAPDECSAAGQMLLQTTNASWETSDAAVADYMLGGLVDTGGDLPPQCSAMCLSMGAQAEYGKVAVCGNGSIETTDSAYCSGGTTPYGDACQVLPPGARAGEQCDPGVSADVGRCDATSCLWKPIGQLPGGTCGNRTIEQGEACDFGRFCLGASPTSTTPDLTPCVLDGDKAVCEANGGTCAPIQTRGCSTFCRHTGSVSGGSTCGNGDIADGEDCDDGNLTNGDGCSSQCLHEGSTPSVASVCGNTIIEPGEACEKNSVSDPTFPSGCLAKTCLHTGTGLCDNDPITPNVDCCGNAIIDAGEDCDDGNRMQGDGCGLTCLLEGSSPMYAEPSFCGDGTFGTGEQCEASENGDGRVDATQLATIIGDADPDESGLMTAQLSATLEGKTGEATYGLQCGFDAESSCPASYGLTDKGCCNLRPALDASYPAGSDVCRNVQISATFNVPMDRGSILANAQIVKKAATDCPSGTRQVMNDLRPAPTGFLGWVERIWLRLLAWWKADPAIAQVWCEGSVTGRWIIQDGAGSQEFVFLLDGALEPQTDYRVKFKGDLNLEDNADLAKRVGIRSSRGVVATYDTSDANGPLTFSFRTGDQVCALNTVQVKDMSEEHPLLFVKEMEQHPFAATAASIQNGVSIPIVPVTEYAWAWSAWATSDGEVVEVKQQDSSTSVIEAKNKNGSAFVVATLKVIKDTVFIPSTLDRVIQGTAPVTVMLCENPWPSLHDQPIAPFRDKQSTIGGDSSLVGSIFENGPYFNFSTIYCRDAGVFGEEDDLPRLDINYVPQTTTDKSEGILRQYLFTYPDSVPELKKDGIGIRIAANPLHLSPEDWYRMLGFGGNPKPIVVDGYRALQDGTTTYVAAANTDGPDKRIYSNIYLISRNPDASPVTIGIYDQMVQSLTFNINIAQGVANVCLQGNAPTDYQADLFIPDGTSRPVACSADVDCLKISEDLHCGSFKLKLARDTERVADFAAMSRDIEDVKAKTGTYPKLAAGSFLQGFSTSRWPSWFAELSSALGGEPPRDPVNQFLSCGRCSQSRTVCGSKEDCPVGQTCDGVSYQGGEFISTTTTEAATCWNTEERKYYCPRINVSPSRVYQYRSVNGGVRYELSAEFEVPESEAPSAEWWSPPLMTEVKRCTNAERLGTLCDVDADCRDCANPKDNVSCTLPIVNGACRTVGGRFLYKDVCTNMAYGQSGTCGDGVIGSACNGGTNAGNPCVDDAGCPGGTCSAIEVCEIGQTRIADCQTVGSEDGLKLQTCNECKEFADDVSISQCDASLACGNGRIDRKCNGGLRNAMGCLADADCAGDTNTPAGICGATNEVCDDGSLNGTYGHCNVTCTGYAAYCGDQQISPGEICDNGSANGAYCNASCNVNQSCSLNCKEKAPHCGDGLVTAPESCDGQTEMTVQAICIFGTAKDRPCTTDADCGESGTCATGGDVLASCQGVTRNRCATSLKQCVTPALATCTGYDSTAHRVCLADTDCANESGGQTACRGLNEFCVDCTGDAQCSYVGIPGSCNVMPTAHVRTCNTPGATNQCSYADWSGCEVQSFCGDGIIDPTGEECDDGSNNGDIKACTASCKKNVCGDGKPYMGVEECDAGSQNGNVTCNADYGSTCASCSTQCRFLTTAGGYCGDAKKNGPEQCDSMSPVEGITNQFTCPATGRPEQVCPYVNADCIQSPCMKTNEVGIKCSQLGYDFPTNGVKPRLISLVPADPVLNATRSSHCPAISGIKQLEYLMFKECLGMKCQNPMNFQLESVMEADIGSERFFTRLAGNQPESPEEQNIPWNLSFQNPMPSENAFWQCVREKGPAKGVGISVDASAELVQCTPSCSFGGCGKCSDEVGTGVIKGQLWDGVYGQIVPAARVSVFYKGILVQQVASDDDGKFIVSGLNSRPECGQYKIVVDKFDDNPCTGNQGLRPNCGLPSAPNWEYSYNVNEGERGGYWPYTSPIFKVNEFKATVAPATSEDRDAQIFIFPRPGTGEAYYSVLWDVDWTNGCTVGTNGNHLILPKEYAYTPAAAIDTKVCDGGANNNKPCADSGDCPAPGTCTKANPGYPDNFSPATCDWDRRPTSDGHQCARDVMWRLPGYADLNKLPYAKAICLHQAGDFSCGNSNDAVNNCPVEGALKCLERKNYDDPNGECTKGIVFYGCSVGESDSGLCEKNADCGPGGVCTPAPCQFEGWETCWYYNKGPLTTYFRYAAMSGATEPIRMFWGLWGKSVHPELNSGSNDLMNNLKNRKYHVVVSTDQRVVEFRAEDLAQSCGKDCKFWHIADLDATTGDITIRNTLRSQRRVENFTEAISAHSYHFQNIKPGVKYCARDVGTVDPDTSDIVYKLYKQCTAQTDCVDVNGAPLPNTTCMTVNYISWVRANF